MGEVTEVQNHNFSKMILCGYRKQLEQLINRDKMLSKDIIQDLVTIRALIDDVLRKWSNQGGKHEGKG